MTKYYFISDCHFGIPDAAKSLVREKLFVDWLEEIRKDAAAIYIMGDLFDFWFEYKTVVQKGFTRLLGKLTEITDSGIPVYFFRGNHDIWTFSYLQQELNIIIHDSSKVVELQGKKFFLAHGDGLGEGDNGYKLMKNIFKNRFNQWLFRWLHPDLGNRFALFWSRRSRLAHEADGVSEVNDRGIARLTGFCNEVLETQPDIRYFVFGHIHKPIITGLNRGAKYISLGDWFGSFTYGVFDGNEFEIKKYK